MNLKAEITSLVKFQQKKESGEILETYYLELAANKRITRINVNYMDFYALIDLNPYWWNKTYSESATGTLEIYTISKTRPK